MNRVDLINKLEQFHEDRRNLYDAVKKYCQDKAQPLEDRWYVFTLSDMGDDDPWIRRYTPIVNDYIEESYSDRYEIITIDDILEWYEETVWNKLSEELDEEPTNEQINAYLEESLKKFKEDTLQNFIKSFKFDW